MCSLINVLVSLLRVVCESQIRFFINVRRSTQINSSDKTYFFFQNCIRCRLDSYFASQPRGKCLKIELFISNRTDRFNFAKLRSFLLLLLLWRSRLFPSLLLRDRNTTERSENLFFFLLNSPAWRTLRGDSHRGKRLFAIASYTTKTRWSLLLSRVALVFHFSSVPRGSHRMLIVDYWRDMQSCSCSFYDSEKFHNSYYNVIDDRHCTIDRLAIY